MSFELKNPETGFEGGDVLWGRSIYTRVVEHLGKPSMCRVGTTT